MGHCRQFRGLPGNSPGNGLSAKEPSFKVHLYRRKRKDPQGIPASVHNGRQGTLQLRVPRKAHFKVNIHENIVNLYNEAIAIASAQESGFQQMLAGIVGRLLSLAYFYDRNSQFKESDTANKIGQAKVMIYDNYMNISPEEIASRLCLSYSSFRKTFKEYTGFSPARFINEVRMSKAKELLTNTSMSIKEVAYHVGYNNHDYFFTAFRHMTGQTPAEYRKMTQGVKA